MLKNGQVASRNVFEILYGREFPVGVLNKGMKSIIMELMAYDNQRQRDWETASRSDDPNMQGTPLSEAMFIAKFPELLSRKVTLLTTEEYEAIK